MRKSIEIDGVRYVPEEPAPKGTRRIVVLDRGWIFAGNISDDGKRLTDVVNVRRWKRNGFGGLCKDPATSGAELDPCEDLVLSSWIFCVEVPDGWGR